MTGSQGTGQPLVAATKQALRRGLSGLVRLALKVGITVDDFEEVVRETYFSCARNDYGLRNRPTNLARVAVLTGLSRKECGRLKRKISTQDTAGVAVAQDMHPATRVMTAWFTDPVYSHEGEPRRLPLHGGGGSLTSLIQSQLGDIPTGAVITELKRLGIVRITDDQSAELIKRSFLPTGINADKLRILANQFEDLGATVMHNLEAEAEPRLQRYVVNDRLPKRHLAEFQTLATDLSQKLLEQLDTWLSERERNSDESQPKIALCRAGLGMYYFQDR